MMQEHVSNLTHGFNCMPLMKQRYLFIRLLHNRPIVFSNSLQYLLIELHLWYAIVNIASPFRHPTDRSAIWCFGALDYGILFGKRNENLAIYFVPPNRRFTY